MVFSSQNVALLMTAFALFTTASAESYIVDKETDDTLVIVAALFLVLSIILLVISVYFAWRIRKRFATGNHGSGQRGYSISGIPWKKKTYRVSLHGENGVDNPRYDNPFRRYSMYSQKSSVSNSIYLNTYETVLATSAVNQRDSGAMEMKQDLYLPKDNTFTSPAADENHDYEYVDPKENRTYMELQGDAQTRAQNTSATTTATVNGVSQENHAYDNE